MSITNLLIDIADICALSAPLRALLMAELQFPYSCWERPLIHCFEAETTNRPRIGREALCKLSNRAMPVQVAKDFMC